MALSNEELIRAWRKDGFGGAEIIALALLEHADAIRESFRTEFGDENALDVIGKMLGAGTGRGLTSVLAELAEAAQELSGTAAEIAERLNPIETRYYPAGEGEKGGTQ